MTTLFLLTLCPAPLRVVLGLSTLQPPPAGGSASGTVWTVPTALWTFHKYCNCVVECGITLASTPQKKIGFKSVIF